MRLVVVVWCLSVVACGDDGGAAVRPDALICPAQTKLIEYTTRAYGTAGPTFPGELCIEGGECKQTVAGRATLCVPLTQFAVRTEAPGYERNMFLFGPDAGPMAMVEAGNDEFVGPHYWAPIMVAYPPTTTGNIVVIAVQQNPVGEGYSGLTNATVDISPSAGTTRAYIANDSSPKPSLTATENGQVLFGNVPPGVVDIDITSNLTTCVAEAGGGWMSPDASQVLRVPVIAGVTTTAVIKCM